MSDDQKRLLEKQLWAVADTLRSSMNADEYKNYILGFIFYKYLSEKQETYAQTLLKADKINFADLRENKKSDQEYIEAIKNASLEKLGFFLSPSQLFSELVKKGKGESGDDKFILEDLKAVLNSIEQTSSGTDSEDDFKGLFADVDLTSVRLGQTEKVKNERVVDILTHLAKIDFKLEDSKSDVLGDAYEYLISQFAAGAGKKAGEFYTPSQVSRLMAMIVTDGKKKLRSVYDPTCGSGSLLLRLGDYAEIASYYGQEYNTTTYNLARMNMILHGVHYTKFKIENGNTLIDDKLPDLKAEAVVANPPFSAKWKSDTDPTLVADERFSQYGRLAPKNKADYAFVTHMLHHLADNGTMVVVLPHGVLYRDKAEAEIRKYIVEKLNYIDAIIGLPENLFYGTTYATALVVFKKCRRTDDDILFIDASKEFKKGKNKNLLLEEHIEQIIQTYKARSVVKKYSQKVSLQKIKENDFNLNIPRYIEVFEKEDEIDVTKVSTQISGLNAQEQKLRAEIDTLCSSLSISSPAKIDVTTILDSRKIRFKDGSDGEYPKWSKKKFSDLFDFVQTNSLAREKLNYEAGQVKNIHYGDIHTTFKTDFNIANELVPFINEGERVIEAHYLKEGDVVIADASEDYGDIGKAIEITFLGGQKLVGGLHTVVARPKTNEILVGFMAIYVKSALYRNEIKQIAQGTKVLGIPKKYLSKINFYIPSIEEQRKIIHLFSVLNQYSEIESRRVELMDKWKNGVIQKMFV